MQTISFIEAIIGECILRNNKIIFYTKNNYTIIQVGEFSQF